MPLLFSHPNLKVFLSMIKKKKLLVNTGKGTFYMRCICEVLQGSWSKVTQAGDTTVANQKMETNSKHLWATIRPAWVCQAVLFSKGVVEELNNDLVLRKENAGPWEGRGEKAHSRKWASFLFLPLRTGYIHLATISLSVPKRALDEWLATCSQLTMCQWKATYTTVFDKTNWYWLAGGKKDTKWHS